VNDPQESDDQPQSVRLAIARARSELHQKIDDRVFKNMRKAGRTGAVYLCGDHITRCLHPSILILALDGEEACHVLGCRAAGANFPCPKCLVPKHLQHRLDLSFTRRTPQLMKEKLDAARAATTKAEFEQILKDVGIHDIEVSARMLICSSYS
jgi:hypothetical protein